jgi:hypothetical protein
MNVEEIITELRDFVRNYITEFDNTCSSFLSTSVREADCPASPNSSLILLLPRFAAAEQS